MTRPQLKLGSHLTPGLAAVALFVMMAVVFPDASFPNPQGFSGEAGIIMGIGYPVFSLGFGSVDGGSMLVAFEIINLVLVVILADTMLLACHENTTGQIWAILTDGDRELKQTLFGDEEGDS